MITKEEWVSWRQSYATQEYLKVINTVREGKKEEIAEGKVVGDELQKEIGRTQGIKDCIDYVLYSFPYIQLEDNNGTESSGVSSNSEG